MVNVPPKAGNGHTTNINKRHEQRMLKTGDFMVVISNY